MPGRHADRRPEDLPPRRGGAAHDDVTSDLASRVATADGGAPLAERLCRATVELLGATGGSLTLASADPERLTVFATDRTAARLEELQDSLGEGPGFDADRSRHVVVARLDRPSSTDAAFEELARSDTDVCTVHALPMRSGPDCLGVITLYTLAPDELDRSVGDQQLLADAVGAVLLTSATLDGAGEVWAGRAVVHQAIGMVASGLGVTVEDALAVLRAHAFAEGSTLLQVAVAVTQRSLTVERSDGGAP